MVYHLKDPLNAPAKIYVSKIMLLLKRNLITILDDYNGIPD
jgi:hypothetical protein